MYGKALGTRKIPPLLWVPVLVTILAGFSGCVQWSETYLGWTPSGTGFWLDFLAECPQDAELCAEIDSVYWGEDILCTGYNIGPLIHLTGSTSDISIDLVGMGYQPMSHQPTIYFSIVGTITVEMEGEEALTEDFDAMYWIYDD